MQINNDIYQTCGHVWWAEDAGFDVFSLRYCMNPVRYGYFKLILLSHLMFTFELPAVLPKTLKKRFLVEPPHLRFCILV